MEKWWEIEQGLKGKEGEGKWPESTPEKHRIRYPSDSGIV